MPALWDEMAGSLKRIKQLLKDSGEKHVSLWIIFAEIEFKKSTPLPRPPLEEKSAQFTDKIFESTLAFCRNKPKKRLCCLYFWMQFHLFRTKQMDAVMRILLVSSPSR